MFTFIFPGVNEFIAIAGRVTGLVAGEFYDDPETS
jgi:hypothetical protein